MKLTISAVKPHVNAFFDARFGRCAYFIFVETETGAWDAFPNPALSSGGGAGTQASQFLVSRGVQGVVSGRFGPNAYEALKAAGVKMYAAHEGIVKDLFQSFLSGELVEFVPTSSSGRSTYLDRHNRSNK